MKYFSLDTVARAYKDSSSTTKDKFWGILAILYSIDYLVTPCVNYSINTTKLSSFLENLFRLADKKTYENVTSEYSVVFSQNWEESMSEHFMTGKPNIVPIIVWAYRNTSFDSNISSQDLFEKFINDFHLSKEIIDKIFSVNFDRFLIEYQDRCYKDEELFTRLGGLVSSNNATIKLNNTFVVANAGDLSRGPFFQPLYASLNTLECLIIFPFDAKERYDIFSSCEKNNNSKSSEEYRQNNLQLIYYGAPGTGKSFTIDSIANKNNSIRTTFHPDSDYSTFVGCYKPVKKVTKSSNLNVSFNKLKEMAAEITSSPAGSKVERIVDFVSMYAEKLCNIVDEYDEVKSLQNLLNIHLGFSNETYLAKIVTKSIEDKSNNAEITYDFVPQAFTTAYVNAWKNLEEPYYLVMEEINRGNCAQIFGDIFQLLDRGEDGISSYKITPDHDLQTYLNQEFADVDIADEEIKSGTKMQLPANLNILATMNTSDQSLFPIDSAFKRRWDWKYIPIDYTDRGHYISCGNKRYSWVDFLVKVNEQIESVTQSEDKKMGGWFVKPTDKEITADKFVSKVVFYLWNDIFKDFAHGGNTIFKDEFDKFHKFFDFKGDVKEEVLEKFLLSFGTIPLMTEQSTQSANDELDESNWTKDNSLFSINGMGAYNKGEVAYNAVKLFVENHPELSDIEIVRIWSELSIPVSNLVILEDTYNKKKSETTESLDKFERRFNVLDLNSGSKIYITKGFTINTIQLFNNIVNSKVDWNIHIEKVSE